MQKSDYISRAARSVYYDIRKNTIAELLKPHLVIYLDVPVETVKVYGCWWCYLDNVYKVFLFDIFSNVSRLVISITKRTQRSLTISIWAISITSISNSIWSRSASHPNCWSTIGHTVVKPKSLSKISNALVSQRISSCRRSGEFDLVRIIHSDGVQKSPKLCPARQGDKIIQTDWILLNIQYFYISVHFRRIKSVFYRLHRQITHRHRKHRAHQSPFLSN